MGADKPITQDPAVQIATELARVHQESYGAGVTNVDVAIKQGFVAVTMDIELTPAEKTLIGSGASEHVQISRERFQLAIRPTFTAVIERATGRTVSGFASRTILEPGVPWSVEVFRFD